MEVIAIAEPDVRWRWEIRHGGAVVQRSDDQFDTAHDAIQDGEDRPPSHRRLQGRQSHHSG